MNDLIVLPQPEPRNDASGAPELGAPERYPRLEYAPSPRWKRFAAPAALALACGLGWAGAARFEDFSRRPSPDLAAAQNAARMAADSAADAAAAAKAQLQEIGVLRDHVEGLKSKLETQAQKTRAAETTIAALQKNLSEQRAEAAAATSQVQAKLEKAQTLARDRPTDRTPVASIGKPAPKPLPAAGAGGGAAAIRSPLAPYRAFVLRDVDDGRAVVEGPGGLEEVGPGDVLPGGARVQRIEKHGPNWVVLTDRGAINPDGRWDD
ncbi:hypothetical protein [uncultured Rhodoblastus sp.]|uniref:hypothetical protein n=1 Tax=uncultured Rhodoblastus sp. TaxID=543037 RepID=UPI0025E34089|nr:hypothetical protein [uncultured Rhodoblastus sp.]